MRTGLILSILLLVVSLGGCGKSTTPGADASPPAAGTDTSWLLATMPPGAIPVSEAKRTAREGDSVVVRGRIGGRRNPMSTDIAVFVMMDPAIPHCKIGQCKKPWDYCCETPGSITANSATVQLVGDTGTPMPIDLTSHAIKPLDEVVIVGTVGPRPTQEVFVIHASKLHRVSG